MLPHYQMSTPSNLSQFQQHPVIFPSPSASMGGQSLLSTNQISQ
jgi:hypothetical protein